MREIDLKTKTGNCRIMIEGHIREIADFIPSGRLAVITDRNVKNLYHNFFPKGLVVEIEPGEDSKTLETVYTIYEKLLDYELDRDGFILGIGGGVVCDLTGFIASTYLRGVRFGFIASTLLAQVDASVGGKNGVNFKGYKNIIGVIKQPEFILCDLNMLKTLEKKEYIGGIAEVIKYGAIMDKSICSYCETHMKDILSMDVNAIGELVYKSVKNKCLVVENDEFESGERKKLNFGHTFAHALEKVTGITHGEAVAIGMNMAASISVKEGFIHENEAIRLRNIIQSAGLPVKFEINPDDIYNAVRKDKKKSGSKIGLVVLKELGQSIIHYVELEKLRGFLNDMCLYSI